MSSPPSRAAERKRQQRQRVREGDTWCDGFWLGLNGQEALERALPIGREFTQLSPAERSEAVQEALELLAANLGGIGR